MVPPQLRGKDSIRHEDDARSFRQRIAAQPRAALAFFRISSFRRAARRLQRLLGRSTYVCVWR